MTEVWKWRTDEWLRMGRELGWEGNGFGYKWAIRGIFENGNVLCLGKKTYKGERFN